MVLCHSRMMYVALGHYNFVTIQWFPFYTLFLIKTLRQGTVRNWTLAALFAAFCLYAELTFSVFLIFLTLILLLGAILIGPARGASRKKASWMARTAAALSGRFSLRYAIANA